MKKRPLNKRNTTVIMVARILQEEGPRGIAYIAKKLGIVNSSARSALTSLIDYGEVKKTGSCGTAKYSIKERLYTWDL